MDESPPYRLDVEGLTDCQGSSPVQNGLTGRPWIGIRFDCCGVYTRVYRNAEGTSYRGCCPRCGRQVTLRVGAGGTDSRFFVAE